MCVCVCVCVHALSCFSCVQLFATLWTVALQASLSMVLSRQEYWSGLPAYLNICLYTHTYIYDNVHQESRVVSAHIYWVG